MTTLSKRWVVVEDAVALPASALGPSKLVVGRIVTHEGDVILEAERSVTASKDIPVENFESLSICEDIEESCLYLGHFTSVYGHALIESLSRFWILDIIQEPYEKIVYHPYIRNDSNLLCSEPLKTMLNCKEISLSDLFSINKVTRFKKLIIPEPLVDMRSGMDPEQKVIYRMLSDFCTMNVNDASLPDRIYISRRKLSVSWMARNPLIFFALKWTKKWWGSIFRSEWITKRTVVNEAKIESLFQKRGFFVLYPEKTDFLLQVAMYQSASILAGFEGSAMHNTVFMKPNVYVINIESVRKVNRVQKMCEELSSVLSKTVPFRGEILDPELQVSRFDISYLKAQLDNILAEKG